MTKEALDTDDEEEKEKIEELPTEFDQLTEWFQRVFGDKLESTSKELMDVGDKNRCRTIGQVDEGHLSPKVDVKRSQFSFVS